MNEWKSDAPKAQHEYSHAGDDAERRQLTVLFCDMVGSTEIAAQLDEGDWLHILRDYQRLVAKLVEGLGGFIAQYLGDGVVAYFGYPSALEDGAARAARAGLQIADEAREACPRLESLLGRNLSVRVGIHTGPVAVGDVGGEGRRTTLAVGVTTNLAARVQAVAEPGTVVMSSATLRLVRGVFNTEDLGAHDLKGMPNPVRLHRVIEPTGASTRLDVGSIEGLTPFVGRADELERLRESWAQAQEGRGQIVLLEGQAGIGKSRLVRELRHRLNDASHRWIECRGSDLHSHTAFYPLSMVIKETMKLQPGQTEEQQLERLEAGLAAMGLAESDTGALFASLLGLAVSGLESPFGTTLESRRKHTLDALSRWVLALAEREPLVLVVEDLHFLDLSTLAWLEAFVERVSEAPVLLLLTFRPGFEPSEALCSYAVQVKLLALSDEQTVELINGITGGVQLPAALREQALSNADGVPLFSEELTRELLESRVLEARGDQYVETGPIPTFSVPATLEDLLMARLDRTGAAKRTAQLASVLGREFSYALLEAVASEAQPLERELASLVAAGVLHRTDELGEASYAFKHTLIQVAAHKSLGPRKPIELHAHVAETLERDFASCAAAEPERLALHCEQGRQFDKAVRYYQRASDQAQQRAATAESIRHLSHAIELLGELPDNAARHELELQLQIELGKTVVAAEGWGKADAEAAYKRASELCSRIGELPQKFQVIRGLVIYYTAKSELRTANELAKDLVQLADQSGDSQLLLPKHMQLGILRYYDGKPSEALTQFEQAIALYEPSAHEHLTRLYGEDLGVLARIWMAWSQWLLGRPDQAIATCSEAQVLAQQVGHQFSLACTFVWTAVTHIMRREPERARQMAERSIEISDRHGFALLGSEGRLLSAWSNLQAPLGESEKQSAILHFQSCVNEVTGSGLLANAPVMLGFLADAYHGIGQGPMALAALNGAFAISMAKGQAQWDAELHRLKGEFELHTQAEENEVEQLFRRAIEIARGQKALSLELRAAVSLGRLLRRQGQPDQARELIAPIHARFEEGFDCPDLVDARELLAN